MDEMLDSMNDDSDEFDDVIDSTAAEYRSLVGLLNQTLADLHVVYIRLRNYHWNVTGVQFTVLHGLFEQQYTTVEAHIDEVAEQVRIVGGYAVGTMTEYLERTRLTEKPGTYPLARQMVETALEDHEVIAGFLRNDITLCTDDFMDEGTADLLVTVLRTLEKQAWMLRATLRQWA